MSATSGAAAVGPGATSASAVDYMSVGYHLIGEPLNLLSRGQAWFAGVLERHYTDIDSTSAALVLGATPWIADLLRRRVLAVKVADLSPAMLRLVARHAEEWSNGNNVECLQVSWLDLPAFERPLSIVTGDNAPVFMSFPAQWRQLCRGLFDRMAPGARFVIRLLCVPARHQAASVRSIVERALAVPDPNLTAVRAELLFAHWDPKTRTIDTEAVLATYEANQALFQPLNERRGTAPNDLVTVSKYRNTGVVYNVPHLDDALDVLREFFDVREVHFGPYELSAYFPLVVATRS